MGVLLQHARPDDMASSAANPTIPLMMGMMKMSADGCTAGSSSPHSTSSHSRIYFCVVMNANSADLIKPNASIDCHYKKSVILHS